MTALLAGGARCVPVARCDPLPPDCHTPTGGAVAGPGTPAADDAQRYLDTVRDAPRAESPSVGLGRYCVLSGDVVGGELVDGGRVAHLSAFPVRSQPSGGGDVPVDVSPVAPPSRRRRQR